MSQLTDKYGRKIDYLRISVTDRCNLRCIYCMPNYDIVHKPHNEILTFEEIEKIVKVAGSLGVNKIRITGGEPLVRKGICDLISILSNIKDIVDLSITTNGIFLNNLASHLKECGLKRINISLDTLNKDKYRFITKTGNLQDVLKGMEKAQEIGFFVKINVVVIKNLNDDEILDFVEFGRKKNICVRFIEFMPTNSFLLWGAESIISTGDIKKYCEKFFNLKKTELLGSGPAEYYKINGTNCVVGFISPISSKFCSSCNRLRLTSDGKLKVCLYNNSEIDLKKHLREGISEDKISELIKKCVLNKPSEHQIKLKENMHSYYAMSQMGG